MSNKRPKKPVWWKNTYFWIGFILIGVAAFGLVRGEKSIRDPGQKEESGLPLIYLGGAVVMLLNGVLSHRQTVFNYHLEMDEREEKESVQQEN
ncbi:MAG: hypothetical protein JST40_14255 [Armatimonadetes bacterium]|nr:hypothetical protein [Armatimonadota bacterium]